MKAFREEASFLRSVFQPLRHNDEKSELESLLPCCCHESSWMLVHEEVRPCVFDFM